MATFIARTATCFLACGCFTLAFGQQTPEVPDETPPPLGTAHFHPPAKNADVEDQPLTPQAFVVHAAVSNLEETELAQLALEKSGNKEVRQLAGQLIRDHRASLQQLRQVAGRAKIAMPGTLDEERQRKQDELRKLEGESFDREFVSTLQASHAQSTAVFESASQAPQLTPSLREYAASTLPKLQQHAQAVQALHR